jgi:uncharacterized protein (DUF1778 family)
MSGSREASKASERRVREARLGFRVDDRTKKLVERAAKLERRSLTDYCLTALNEAARQTLARNDALFLSERDRQIFFDTLIHPPKPNAHLKRAFKLARERIVR